MNTSKNKLTVLLPFKNEREEVALTCKSIRDTAGDQVDIIVLNDDSDKNFNYKTSLAPYNVEYHESNTRLGSSMGKQWLVDHCMTPYFLILDAHCRIYTENWLEIALKVLEKNENCVYCCAVQYFSNEQDHQDPKHMKAFGGFWDYNPKSILSCGWNLNNFTAKLKGNPPFDIPCILGANYLCSKYWWNKIGGYNGLLLYGREETFISTKSWMAGGKVKCIPSILTGHTARANNHQPYVCMQYEVVHNEMVCGYITLEPQVFQKLMQMWSNIYWNGVYRKAKTLFDSHVSDLNRLREEFNKIKKISHEEVDVFNAKFQRKMGFDYRKLREKIKGTYNLYGENTRKVVQIG